MEQHKASTAAAGLGDRVELYLTSSEYMKACMGTESEYENEWWTKQ